MLFQIANTNLLAVGLRNLINGLIIYKLSHQLRHLSFIIFCLNNSRISQKLAKELF